MASDINTIIFDDDFFARHWMGLILARDWRTRVAASAGNIKSLKKIINEIKVIIHCIILDVEDHGSDDLISQMLDYLCTHKDKPVVILTGIIPDQWVLPLIKKPCVKGYLLKSEIRYSLAWAVELAVEGRWVVTPKVNNFLSQQRIPVPRPLTILEGQNTFEGLTENQVNTARLAFIYSMEREELANEQMITSGSLYNKIGTLYQEIGVKQLLDGSWSVEEVIGDRPVLQGHFKAILEDFKTSPGSKARQMETLAFHMLTMPEIEDWGPP